ncbi:hypothetical protein BKA70DRAFT_1223571 [Coprinopsis sp. MPI-PUGE-AT-0042]|nr:hypothetical protein BKA70DRAFT_1223571 [Coprinopsis sp. MPI-PUGE-AT-0042]
MRDIPKGSPDSNDSNDWGVAGYPYPYPTLENPAKTRTREQGFKTDPLYECGKQIARSIHPFVDFTRFVSKERAVQTTLQLNDLAWKETEPKDRLEHKMFLEMTQLMVEAGDDPWNNVTSVTQNILELEVLLTLQPLFKTQKGFSSAYTHDIKALRLQLPGWVVAQASSSASIPETLEAGFSCDLIGSLLCPITHEWSSESVKQVLRSSPQAIGLDTCPKVLYQLCEYNKDNAWEGFLQNRLLVKESYHSLYVSQLFQQLTPALGVSVLAVLSEGSDAYERGALRGFYRILSAHMQHPLHHAQVKDLLEWWNRQVYGNAQPLSATALGVEPTRMLTVAEKIAGNVLYWRPEGSAWFKAELVAGGLHMGEAEEEESTRGGQSHVNSPTSGICAIGARLGFPCCIQRFVVVPEVQPVLVALVAFHHDYVGNAYDAHLLTIRYPKYVACPVFFAIPEVKPVLVALVAFHTIQDHGPGGSADPA